jgi:Sulfotransferase family
MLLHTILGSFLSFIPPSNEKNFQPEENPKKIYFHHIPKTAGTSVFTYLTKNLNKQIQFLYPDVIIFKKDDAFSRYPNYISYPSFSNFLKNHIFENPHSSFATTHIPFFLLQDFSNNLMTLTILRDPVKRQISHIKFFEMMNAYRPELVNYANYHLLSSIYTYNFQTLYLSQLNPWDTSISIKDHLESAKDTLETKITFFGLTEYLDASLKEFCKLINITPSVHLSTENTTFDKNIILKEKIDEDLLRNENWADIELYNFAKKLFFQRYPHVKK